MVVEYVESRERVSGYCMRLEGRRVRRRMPWRRDRLRRRETGVEETILLPMSMPTLKNKYPLDHIESLSGVTMADPLTWMAPGAEAVEEYDGPWSRWW